MVFQSSKCTVFRCMLQIVHYFPLYVIDQIADCFYYLYSYLPFLPQSDSSEIKEGVYDHQDKGNGYKHRCK